MLSNEIMVCLPCRRYLVIFKKQRYVPSGIALRTHLFRSALSAMRQDWNCTHIETERYHVTFVLRQRSRWVSSSLGTVGQILMGKTLKYESGQNLMTTHVLPFISLLTHQFAERSDLPDRVHSVTQDMQQYLLWKYKVQADRSNSLGH